jgi:hypothetical protein
MRIWAVTIQSDDRTDIRMRHRIFHGSAKSARSAAKKGLRLAAAAGMVDPYVSRVIQWQKRDF